jgi:hypothetical protein
MLQGVFVSETNSKVVEQFVIEIINFLSAKEFKFKVAKNVFSNSKDDNMVSYESLNTEARVSNLAHLLLTIVKLE